jgi:uroporphyrinogen-III synthase
MPDNNINILSTRRLSDNWVSVAALYDVIIQEVPLINIKTLVTDDLKEKIASLSGEKIVAVFTSLNAVYAVKEMASGVQDWQIACIGHQTAKTVSEFFGDENLVATAANATALAEAIINLGNIKKVYFFCGNLRRDELPSVLTSHGIEVEEVVVYETTETPERFDKKYDGILFFNPLAVQSFFKMNSLTAETTIFTIGKTTAAEVALYTNIPTLAAPYPEQEIVLQMVLEHFGKIKSN